MTKELAEPQGKAPALQASAFLSLLFVPQGGEVTGLSRPF